MQLTLDQHVIVIVGGTTGLGRAAARACAAAGAHLVVVGLDTKSVDETCAELGDVCLGLTGDAGSPVTAQRAVELAARAFGRLDGLYHVAGGSGRSKGDGPLHELTDEGIAFTLKLNLESVIYSNRAAVRQFRAQQSGGSVVNLASVLASSPAPAYFATHTYAAAKAGIIGLTTACAAHYASENIRFNALAPALVDTPMAKRAASDPAIVDYIARKQPLDGGRIGQPEDLDAAVVYLLCDASRFVTGQTLAVDGGWSVSDPYPSPDRDKQDA